jgi:Kef-type K+ transport system membrane component KefB
LAIVVMPRLEQWFFARYGNRIIEPELKGAFAALLVLMWLGDQAQSHAVLPAFLLGLAFARTFHRHHVQAQRFRVVAFAMLTPFFFLRSGMNVSLGRYGSTSACSGCFWASGWHASSSASTRWPATTCASTPPTPPC